MKTLLKRLCSRGRREVEIGTRRIVILDSSIEVRRIPNHGSQVRALAGNAQSAGGLGVGTGSGCEPFIFFCSGAGVECDRISWLKTVRVGATHLGDGHKDPIELLLAAEGNAHTGYRHRILAEIYDLDAEAVCAVAPHPATGNDLQAQPGALQEQPEIGHAEHDSDDSGDNGEHAAEPAAAVSAQQSGKGAK